MEMGAVNSEVIPTPKKFHKLLAARHKYDISVARQNRDRAACESYFQTRHHHRRQHREYVFMLKQICEFFLKPTLSLL